MTDAFAWLAARTRKTPTRIVLGVLFAAPLLTGIAGRLVRDRGLYDDFEAVLCAGRNALAGAPLYGAPGACADLTHTPFVYLPWVADLMAGGIAGLGEAGASFAYLAVYLGLAGFMLHRVFLAGATPGSLVERWAFMALITGSALALGNVAIPLHGLVLAGALTAMGSVVPFALALGLAGAVKPILLTFGVVLLCAPLSWPRRIAGGALAVGLAAAPTLVSLVQGGPAIAAWIEITRTMAVDVAPGDGLWGWLSLLGVSGVSPAGLGVYLAYALAVTAAGWVIAERGQASPLERIWLGLAVGTLLIPRLMAIDVFLLAPGLIVAARAARQGARWAFPWASRLVLGGCAAAMIMGVVDLGDYALKAALFCFACAVLVSGGALAAAQGRAPEKKAF